MKPRKRVKWNPEATAADNALRQLPRLAEAFFAEGRKAARKSSSIERLHDFRLTVKRFRYTLELFRPIYGAALDRRLSDLHRLQQHLGTLNDCATTRGVLLATSDEQGVLLSQLLTHLEETEKASKKKALKYWKACFDPPEEEAKWVRYFKTYAGRAQHATSASVTPVQSSIVAKSVH